MELLVFYLSDVSRHYAFPHFIEMINKSHKKNKWKLLIATHTGENNLYIDVLAKYDISYDIVNVPGDNNYLRKVNYALTYAKENNIPYIMKCDNDIFIKSQTFDYMIDNLNLLENGNHLTIGPTLTSGIPSIEYFIESFLDEEAITQIKQMFLKTQLYDRDGACYDFLNKHTVRSTEWDKESYFNSVKNMDHHYKGIHPIRFNQEALHFLNAYIMNNKERFMKDYELSIIDNDNSPYLCNSIFCIKTDTYDKIVSDGSLYVDPFDEVPVNKYAWNNNMNHLFVKNGYAIHMYYNWMDHHHHHEYMFCKNFFTS